MKKVNAFDKFLDFYRERSEIDYEYVKVYNRPSKVKCGIMFAIAILLLIIIVRFLLSPTLIFAIIFVIDLLVCVYYGYNLFSKNGFVLGKTIKVKKEDIDE